MSGPRGPLDFYQNIKQSSLLLFSEILLHDFLGKKRVTYVRSMVSNLVSDELTVSFFLHLQQFLIRRL